MADGLLYMSHTTCSTTHVQCVVQCLYRFICVMKLIIGCVALDSSYTTFSCLQLFVNNRKMRFMLFVPLAHSSPSPLTPATPPDFIVRVRIENHPVRFFVHKRPHVDFFLSMVSLFVSVNNMPIYG